MSRWKPLWAARKTAQAGRFAFPVQCKAALYSPPCSSSAWIISSSVIVGARALISSISDRSRSLRLWRRRTSPVDAPACSLEVSRESRLSKAASFCGRFRLPAATEHGRRQDLQRRSGHRQPLGSCQPFRAPAGCRRDFRLGLYPQKHDQEDQDRIQHDPHDVRRPTPSLLCGLLAHGGFSLGRNAARSACHREAGKSLGQT